MTKISEKDIFINKFGYENYLSIITCRENRLITMFRIFLCFEFYLAEIYSNSNNMQETGSFILNYEAGETFFINPFNAKEDPEYFKKLADFSLPKLQSQRDCIVKRYGFNEETRKGLDNLLKLVEKSPEYDSEKFCNEFEKNLLLLTVKRQGNNDNLYSEILSNQYYHYSLMKENKMFGQRLSRLDKEKGIFLFRCIIGSYNALHPDGLKVLNEDHNTSEHETEKAKQC